MHGLPAPMLTIMGIFSPLFSSPTYYNFVHLTFGHIVCKGRRTITEILKQLGLRHVKNYSKYHDVFSRAKWSALGASKALFLRLLTLVQGSIVISIDSTVERRKGPKIKGLGIQRDAVRSTRKKKVLTPGLNWLVTAIHITFPWHDQGWALPFLTLLMPPEKPLASSKNLKDIHKKSNHKTLNEWACQIAHVLRRWIGPLKFTLVADSAFATYILANTCIDLSIVLISRMRLDARFYTFPPTASGKRGRKRLVGQRMLTPQQLAEQSCQNWNPLEVRWYGGTRKTIHFLTDTCLWYGYGIRPVPIRWVLVRNAQNMGEPICLFSTELNSTALEIIETFVARWKIEVTFEEARRHLGIETQRQWSDNAIDRITPCLFASYSVINLIALQFIKTEGGTVPIQTSSWYQKSHVTFSDVLAYVREKLLREKYFLGFDKTCDLQKINIEEWIALMAAA